MTSRRSSDPSTPRRARPPLGLDDARRICGEQSNRSLRDMVQVLEQRAASRYDDDPDDRRMEAARLVLADRQRRLFRTGVLVAITAFLWLLALLGTDRPVIATLVSLAVAAAIIVFSRNRK